MNDIIRKCPKCNKEALYYEELWKDHCIQFGIENGKIEKDGSMGMGNPYKVKAICGCGHCWTVKGVTQISELRQI